MNLQDEFAATQRKLNRLQEEHDSLNAKRAAELEQARKDNLPEEQIQKLEAENNQLNEFNVSGIEDTKARLDALQILIDGEEKEARAKAQEELEAMKETARRAWVTGGGDPAGFELAWVQMKQDLLKQRAFAALKSQQREMSEIIKKTL